MGLDIGGLLKKGVEGFLKGGADIVDRFVQTKDEAAAMNLELGKLAETHFQSVQDDATKQLELEIKNTSDARAMEIAIQAGHPSWLSRNVSYLIDLFVMCVWGGMTVYIALRALKLLADAHQVDFSVILGIYAAVSTQMGTVLNFHRGSSKSSEDKGKQIDRMTQK